MLLNVGSGGGAAAATGGAAAAATEAPAEEAKEEKKEEGSVAPYLLSGYTDANDPFSVRERRVR